MVQKHITLNVRRLPVQHVVYTTEQRAFFFFLLCFLPQFGGITETTHMYFFLPYPSPRKATKPLRRAGTTHTHSCNGRNCNIIFLGTPTVQLLCIFFFNFGGNALVLFQFEVRFHGDSLIRFCISGLRKIL